MSVYSKMLSDRKGDSAELCTIDLAMEVIASVLYKISSAFILLRSVRSYPSFLNSAVRLRTLKQYVADWFGVRRKYMSQVVVQQITLNSNYVEF